jgi:hypothetical protein
MPKGQARDVVETFLDIHKETMNPKSIKIGTLQGIRKFKPNGFGLARGNSSFHTVWQQVHHRLKSLPGTNCSPNTVGKAVDYHRSKFTHTLGPRVFGQARHKTGSKLSRPLGAIFNCLKEPQHVLTCLCGEGLEIGLRDSIGTFGCTRLFVSNGVRETIQSPRFISQVDRFDRALKEPTILVPLAGLHMVMFDPSFGPFSSKTIQNVRIRDNSPLLRQNTARIDRWQGVQPNLVFRVCNHLNSMTLNNDRKPLKQSNRTNQNQRVVLLTNFLNANGDPVNQGVSLRQWFILAVLKDVRKVLGPSILGKLVALTYQAGFILLHVVMKSIEEGHDNIQNRTAEGQGNTNDREEPIRGPPRRKTPREPNCSSDCPPGLIPIYLSIPSGNTLLQ